MPRQFNDDPSRLRTPTLIVRLLAMVYDTLIVLAIWMLIGGVAVALNQGEAIDSPLGLATLKSLLLITTFLFFGFFWTRSGQTLGMMAWRLRAQSETGFSLSWTQAMIRFFAAMLSIALFGLGYWITIFSDQKVTWHERWSNSVTVRITKN
ncbi:RDD family protein [Marinobacterium sp. LSUCC0821]|uniref:RDD family protein n=1 Tax=Marinobacterium sp. LSUCC0821 TaxID=2668067 RepID=UPI0014523C86|nr:RDD family protein [Marinobacterium sp. LSUCC0821]QJD70286.1 RDD family protein [Marinobacterium sp. LSUCC0821]